MTPINIPEARKHTDPEVVKALCNCVRFWVSHWYADADGNDAEVKPDSPVWLAANSLRDVFPAALDEIEELRAEVERLKRETQENDRIQARWVHGQQIESDYICPAELEAYNLRTRLEEVERERDAARVELDQAWAATEIAGAVRGLGGTKLSDVVCDHRTELAELRAEIEKWKRYRAAIDEALNSGSGSYKP